MSLKIILLKSLRRPLGTIYLTGVKHKLKPWNAQCYDSRCIIWNIHLNTYHIYDTGLQSYLKNTFHIPVMNLIKNVYILEFNFIKNITDVDIKSVSTEKFRRF